MNRKAVKWLYAELPGLVEARVISTEAAEALKRHYAESSADDGRNLALTIFSVIGATLIGLGLILLVAHNWNALSRPVRVVIALLPLLVGQLLAAYALKSQPASRAWGEATASFVMLALGLALALISQTYQTAGELGDLLLVWMLLSLPLVYLLGSCMVATLCVVGLTVWAGMPSGLSLAPQLYWLLLAAVLPHYRRIADVNRGAILAWVMAACGFVALFRTLPNLMHQLWMPIIATYLAAIYLGSARRAAETPWHRSLRLSAAQACVLLALALTLKMPWYSLRFSGWPAASNLELSLQLAVLGSLSAWFILGLLRQVSREPLGLLLASLPLLTWLAYGLHGQVGASFGVLLLFNLYVLAVGLLLVRAGLKNASLRALNAGLVTLAALVVMRFFDLDLSFVSRGLGFILIGAGFLAANLYLVRQREAGHE